MAKISDIVNVTITRETRFPTVVGFGRGAVIAEFLVTKTVNTLLGDGRYQLYSDLDGMLADGWLTTDEVYQAALEYFSQSPNPGTFMIGRKDAAENWIEALTAIQHVFEDWYGFTIVETTLTEVSEVSAWAESQLKIFGYTSSLAAIVDGPTDATAGSMTTGITGTLAAFQAVSDGEFSIDVDGAGSVDITVLDFSSIITKAGIAEVLNANVAFAAIALASYDTVSQRITITSLSTGASSMVSALAVPGVPVGTDISIATYLNGLTGTVIIVDGLAASTDFASVLKDLGYDRTVVNYHTEGQDKAAIAVADIMWMWMAMMGEAFPYDPGSQTWAFKELAGISTVVLTTGQEANAKSKNVNIYQLIAGQNIVLDGRVIGGEYIDIIRGTDWLTSELQTAVYSQLLNNRKVPHTDPGITLVENAVRGVLRTAANRGLLDPESIVVTVPKVSDTLAANRAARALRDVQFTARYQGAIQKVLINGTISV